MQIKTNCVIDMKKDLFKAEWIEALVIILDE